MVGRARFGSSQMYGLGLAHPKKKRKDYIGLISAQLYLGRDRPILFWAEFGPAHIFCNIIIIIIIIIYYYYYYYIKKKQKIQKFSKNHFKKIMIFSNIFLPLLYNIGCIFTVKYKSSIKIPGFLRNISKK